jgi:polysaccharide export outer membrane protein
MAAAEWPGAARHDPRYAPGAMTDASAPPHRPLRARGPVTLLVAALLATGCRTVDTNFVWVESFPEPPADVIYLIAPGDVLGVRVYNQEGMSAKVKVRSDGMISLPFLGDVSAARETPVVLAERIQARLKDFVVNPVVTVTLDEGRPLEVSVVGEVLRPGLYRLEPGAGVLTALAAASGFSDFANREKIFVLRNGTTRVRFTYAALSQARTRAGRFALRPGDVVIVE